MIHQYDVKVLLFVFTCIKTGFLSAELSFLNIASTE